MEDLSTIVPCFTPRSNLKIKQPPLVAFAIYSKGSQKARRFEILCLCASSLVGDSAIPKACDASIGYFFKCTSSCRTLKN